MIERHTKALLRDAANNLLLAVAFFVCALVLDFVNHWCIAHGASDWLVFGIELVSKIVFIFDAAVFLSTVALTGVHFLREYYNRLFNR